MLKKSLDAKAIYIEAFYLVIFDKTALDIHANPSMSTPPTNISTKPTLYNLKHGHLIKPESLVDVFFNLSTVLYRYFKKISALISYHYKYYLQYVAVVMQKKRLSIRKHIDYDFRAEYWDEIDQGTICIYTNRNTYKNIIKLKNAFPEILTADDKYYNVAYCIAIKYLNINEPSCSNRSTSVIFKSI